MGTRKVFAGQRYGKWVVTEGEMRRHYDGCLMYKCRCDCGFEAYIPGSRLLTKKTTMCMECNLKRPMPDGMKKINDLTGRRFGKWTVIRRAENRSYSKTAVYLCRCDCGSESIIPGYPLTSNKTRGCNKCRDRSGYKGPTWTGYQEIPGKWFSKTKTNANRRGLEYSLEKEFVWRLFVSQYGRCALSGIPIHFGDVSVAGGCTASLDRIDSSKGYTEDNVQFVHAKINRLKMNMPQEEFLRWVRLIAINQIEHSAN